MRQMHMQEAVQNVEQADIGRGSESGASGSDEHSRPHDPDFASSPSFTSFLQALLQSILFQSSDTLSSLMPRSISCRKYFAP